MSNAPQRKQMLELASNATSIDQPGVMRFRAITDADPCALVCVLERLRAHSLVPKTVQAYRLDNKFIEMKIEIDGLSHESFRRILAKIDEMPMVVAAVAFDVDWAHSDGI